MQKFKDTVLCISLMKESMYTHEYFMWMFIDTHSHKCFMFFKIREMRTKVNLDPDAVLVTQYSASQPDVSYESIWKRRVSKILAGEKRELK